ncbi:MAG: DUF308 domain-containing protein [Clostridia bacterium]|nr:DUF308 domain-containing protein [Clostridia bacterium]
MRKSEKIVAAVFTMVLGILLIVLKDDFIGLLMTVAGLCLLTLGVIDIFAKRIPPAIVKIVVGGLVILCGWTVVEAVLYVVAAVLLICGFLLLYDKIKKKTYCRQLFYTICEYAVPSLLILIGILFLFHQEKAVNFIFIVSGLLTLLEGGVLLVNALTDEAF